jgi:hypothetical protein
MSIKVQCKECGSVLKIKEELAGTEGKCPKCKTPFRVPELTAAATSGAAASGATSTSGEIPAVPKSEATAPAVPVKAEAEKPAPPVVDKPSKAISAEESPALVEVPKPAAKQKKLPAEADVLESPSGAQNGKLTSKKPLATEAPASPSQPAPAPASGDDAFDPVAFLMAEGKPKPKAPLAQPPRPEPPGGRKFGDRLPPGGKRLELSDDDDSASFQDETTPPPKSGPRSAAETANAMLSGGASSTAASAKDFLARSAAESRHRASQMPSEDRGPRIDYVGALKEVLRPAAPYIVGTLVLCVGLYWMMSRMMGGGIPLPRLAAVYGKLTLQGQPLPNVTIYFTPIGAKDGSYFEDKKIRQHPRESVAVTKPDGSYELMYLPQEGVSGGVIGKNRIWLEPLDFADFKKIPGAYLNVNTSSDIRDVKSGSNEINISL